MTVIISHNKSELNAALTNIIKKKRHSYNRKNQEQG